MGLRQRLHDASFATLFGSHLYCDVKPSRVYWKNPQIFFSIDEKDVALINTVSRNQERQISEVCSLDSMVTCRTPADQTEDRLQCACLECPGLAALSSSTSHMSPHSNSAHFSARESIPPWQPSPSHHWNFMSHWSTFLWVTGDSWFRVCVLTHAWPPAFV